MKKGFFDDKNGDHSMMRLLSFMVVSVGLGLIIFAVVWSLVYEVDSIAIITALIGLVGTGMGLKWAQKTTEKDQ